MSVSLLLYILLGLGAGFTSGLLGIGGGVIYVPAIMFIAGASIHAAIGISLAVIVPSAAAAALRHYAAGNVDMTVVALILPAAIIGAIIGVYVNGLVPATYLKKIFGVCLILIGLNTVLGPSRALEQQNLDLERASTADVEID